MSYPDPDWKDPVEEIGRRIFLRGVYILCAGVALLYLLLWLTKDLT